MDDRALLVKVKVAGTGQSLDLARPQFFPFADDKDRDVFVERLSEFCDDIKIETLIVKVDEINLPTIGTAEGYTVSVEPWGHPDGSGDKFGFKFVGWICNGSMVITKVLAFTRDGAEAAARRWADGRQKELEQRAERRERRVRRR